MYGHPRCREWTPLSTQQMRLRNLLQITGHNMQSETRCSFYYTLHLTSMSAPFYTSEKIENKNPAWDEIDCEFIKKSSSKCIFVRVWKHSDKMSNDLIILTWGIFFSGLVFIENRHSSSFQNNTLVFQMNGGFFTSSEYVICEKSTKIFKNDEDGDTSVTEMSEDTKIEVIPNSKTRYTTLGFLNSEIRKSYNVEKLLRLQELQHLIKSKRNSDKVVREKISMISAACLEVTENISNPIVEVKKKPNADNINLGRLNRYILQQNPKPDPARIRQALQLHKQIESQRFIVRLLSSETDSTKGIIRSLQAKKCIDNEFNNDLGSTLMARYHSLSKDIERLRQWKISVATLRESVQLTRTALYRRQAKLLSELLEIYPISENQDNVPTILDVPLPDAESINSIQGSTLSVSLGFAAHVVVMCSIFLNIPLRYPIIHMGSRSRITDNITENIPEAEREFPLHYHSNPITAPVHYGVYLLNKNIAQLRWLIGLPTKDLRATLSNLKGLLLGLGNREKLLNVQSNTASISGSSIDLVAPPVPVTHRAPLAIPCRKTLNHRVSRSMGSYTENQLLEAQVGNFSSEPVLSAKIIETNPIHNQNNSNIIVNNISNIEACTSE